MKEAEGGREEALNFVPHSSVGLITYYLLSKGHHPYGSKKEEREEKICNHNR